MWGQRIYENYIFLLNFAVGLKLLLKIHRKILASFF